ncbi:helix-turn-helix domain-containing protein [Noviherbaspirillum suwonense]|uniref:DNA-binding transcriptional regulator, XRE-family HTH domain n=1 Tax=Noviherbaspirillum suwonense TaxID=1224511 RepID=A0ABY1Q937_9BURK|nr:helix-turn-helix transcriptional regulator [Noviherbaspirillum suwonense]SMP62264.1 DNA-binding transcriptional regulator, XRE-family HTH domain [Noviherbaspirillum suwonense]
MQVASSAASLSREQYFSDFSAALRYWRRKRGYSQLELSSLGVVSQRHISFLESGRSRPSRELILRLGVLLEIPLRQRNVMLLAAGFAPAYQERRLSDPELDTVRQALELMLAQQAPYPALVVDRLWNLHMSNGPAASLIGWLLDLPAGHSLPGDGAVNVIRLMLEPSGLRPHLVNWREVGADMLHWIQREAMSDGPASPATRLLAELLPLTRDDTRDEQAAVERHVLPFLPVTLRKDGVELRLFTTIATLGTPRDVTVHELRVESFFPADEATAQWFRERAATTG